MKGADASGRRFVTFKCTAHAPEPRRLFTTLFQRYRSDPTGEALLYHTAGHYGTHLFTTTGGAGLVQLERMRDLVRAGRIALTVGDMRELRVGYRDHDEIPLR